MPERMLRRARRRTDRVLQIGEVFAKHGLGFLLGGLNEPWSRRLSQVRLLDPEARIPQAAHLRMALEELGPAFIKIGQLLSSRQDLLPADYVAELARLQDSSPAVPFDEILADLAGSPEQDILRGIQDLDPRPLASGSIGQVHTGRLDALPVVVKIRKPGVREEVDQDLEIMTDLARLMARYVPAARQYDVLGLARQFAESLTEELDYLVEARNAAQFATNFAEDPGIRIPWTDPDRCTSRLLVQERVEGIKISRIERLEQVGVDRHQLALTATEAMCQMVFRDGLFHADPHPGNLFVHPDGSISLIDFGMVGRLDPEFRDRLVPLLVGLTTGNARQTARAVLRLTTSTGEKTTSAQLAPDVARILKAYTGRSLEHLDVGALVKDISDVFKRHGLVLPPEAALLVRMIVTVESLGEMLDPDFDIVSVLRPQARRFVASRLSPAALTHRLQDVLKGAADLGMDMPDTLRRVMEVIEDGGFDIRLRADELDELIDRVEVVGQRLVVGAVLAAVINGTAKVVASDPVSSQKWHRVLVAAGAGGTGALGSYLAWSMRPRLLRGILPGSAGRKRISRS